MNNGGNGKTSPQVVAAQRRVEAALKPLQAARQRVAGTRMRLGECEQSLAIAQRDHNKAAERYTDDDNAANRAVLFRTAEDVKAAESRVRGFTKKLAEEEAAIASLNLAHQTAAATLAQLMLQENCDAAERECQALRTQIYEAEALKLRLENELDAAANRRMFYWNQIQQGRANAAKVAQLADAALRPTTAQTAVTRTRHGF